MSEAIRGGVKTGCEDVMDYEEAVEILDHTLDNKIRHNVSFNEEHHTHTAWALVRRKLFKLDSLKDTLIERIKWIEEED